jgi:hypothetical protein
MNDMGGKKFKPLRNDGASDTLPLARFDIGAF